MGFILSRILVINHRSLIAAGDVNGVIAQKPGDVAFRVANFGSIKNSSLDVERGIFKESLISFEMSAQLVIDGVLRIELGDIEISLVKVNRSFIGNNHLKGAVSVGSELTAGGDLSQNNIRGVSTGIDKLSAVKEQLIGFNRTGCLIKESVVFSQNKVSGLNGACIFGLGSGEIGSFYRSGIVQFF